MRTTRRASLGFFLSTGLGSLAFLGGCGASMGGAGEGRRFKPNSKVIAYNFARDDRKSKLEILTNWLHFLEGMDSGGIALLEALKEKQYSLRPIVEMEAGPKDPRSAIPSYKTKVLYWYPKKDFKEPDASDQSIEAKMARATMAGMPPTEVDKAVFAKGAGALMGVAVLLMSVTPSGDAMTSAIFAIRVWQEALKAGKDVDIYDEKRPVEESLADTDLTLKLLTESHAEYMLLRTRLVATLALFRAFDVPGGLDEVKAELKEQRQMIEEWVKNHPEPNPDDFGVGMAEAELPSSSSLMKWLDDNMGFATAIAKVAGGIVVGSPQATLEGLALLAPEDTTIKTVLEGIAAATKGDIQGVITATAELTGLGQEVKSVKDKVASVKNRLGRVKNAMDAAGIKVPV